MYDRRRVDGGPVPSLSGREAAAVDAGGAGAYPSPLLEDRARSRWSGARFLCRTVYRAVAGRGKL